jgi:hypothetical protein
MVLVLGILSLLALTGLVLITRTHGEFRRVAEQSASSSSTAVRDGIVRKIREVLRADVWGGLEQAGLAGLGRPLSNSAAPGTTNNPFGLLENNEPWDAPGESDRWLASLTPHPVGRVEVFNDPAATPPTPMQMFEDDVLAWREVSYLGSDVNLPKFNTSGVAINPFTWAQNSRRPDASPGANTLVRYDATNLSNVEIIQTPTPLFVGPLIPGSTTNATIRAARAYWNGPAHRALLGAQLALPSNAAILSSVVPRFPYFDTNSDGEVDLYDADGDGVPDSPISFVVETDSPDPDRPRQLYAVIRIVDHAAMTNVNTASGLTLPSGPPAPDPDGLTFDETLSGFQRRGRRATEFVMDDVVHHDDWFLGSNRTSELAGYRNNSVPSPISYDQDVVRRTLIGGLPGGGTYNIYGLGDEASLRHRGMLVPYDRRDDRTAANTDYQTIDRALRGSLLWSRRVMPNFSYDQNPIYPPRWSRLNANLVDPNDPNLVNPDYEGFANAGGFGWRDLLDQDEPFAVRRPLLTTVNVEVMPPPDITARTVAGVSASGDLDLRLRQLWALGMSWPVLIGQSSTLLSDPNLPAEPTLIDDFTVPDDRVPAEWARVQPIDLNMGTTVSTNVPDVKDDFLRYAAAATYLALDGVGRYQGMPVAAQPLNREYLAWQFAANLKDFRDSDNDPTIIEWPTQPGRFIFGVEKQPFFTEAYAHLTAGANPSGVDDKWFFAFELYVPPGWNIPTGNLYFRSGPEPALLPLNNFVQVTSGLNLAASGMDGGPADVASLPVTDTDHGNYYIFANDPTLNMAPPGITLGTAFQARAYVNNALTMRTNGRGRLELVYSLSGTPGDPQNHVLDVIGPSYSGGDLANDTSSGQNFWAKRVVGMSANAELQFSLRRSTKGWRFTTCWHVYTRQPAIGASGDPLFGVSLGRPNAVLDDLNDNIPESIWPAITTLDSSAVNPSRQPHFLNAARILVDGFESGLPFEAFDSVADLGRMFMIGPVNLAPRPPLPALPVLLEDQLKNLDLPTTALIAATVSRDIRAAPADLPPLNIDRVAAGRVDFAPSGGASGSSPPWTWRLFDYFTTQSHLFDGIDNDGDGDIDLRDGDPTEAVDVLFRAAGRMNLNTAPARVLRSGPFMSLLPTSAEFNFFDGGLAGSNPALSFQNSAAGFYYDFASAVVAMREDRDVPLRLLDGATGLLQTVAVASLSNFVAKPAVTIRGAFAQVIELAELAKNRQRVLDDLNFRDDMFQVDRFWSNSTLKLLSHKIRAADPFLGPFDPADPFDPVGVLVSPDFRYRVESNTTDYVPIQHVGGLPPLDPAIDSDPLEAGGIRGRDVFLSRWTNVFSTRSDCFTAYVGLLDEDGNIVQRSQVTLDRSDSFSELPPTVDRRTSPILPRILVRSDGSYADDTK